MFKKVASFVAALAIAASVLLVGCSSSASQEPVSLTVWTYYNGDQLAAFQNLTDQFNSTVGAEKGITVVSSNVGSVNDLQDAVMDSANGKVGAAPMPNIFMAYADTAYAIDKMGLLADLSPYLSEEERALYVDGYLEEGVFGDGSSIKIFPIAKSTEVLLLNVTDFETFAQATGVSYADLATIESVTEVAQRYYEYTDSLTPEPNDGKAFFGRDSMANYVLIGAKQLGDTIVEVDGNTVILDFDKQIARKIWDNYYVPYVKGYFDASGRYRSDDVKTGNIIALVGSSSGATFFPEEVVDESGNSRAIEMAVLPAPQFEGGTPVAVQQGAGMVVIDSSEEEVQASVEFLEWFTAKEQNLQFSIASGYLPVTKDANDMAEVDALGDVVDARMRQILEVAMNEVEKNELYTPQAFEQGTALRDVLEYSLSDKAQADLAAVSEAVEGGQDYDDALASYLSDSNFEQWYSDTLAQLQDLVS